jgi:uncharacterized repeat protein (TIGR01451 family)
MKTFVRLHAALLLLFVSLSASSQPLSCSITQGDTIWVCPGTSAQLDAVVTGGTPVFNYVWSGSSQLSNTGTLITHYQAGGDTSEMIIFTVTDNVGASASDTIIVMVPYIPVTTGGTQTICIGNPATLIASGGISYQWSTGETTPYITVAPLVNTTYTVTITYLHGCTNVVNFYIMVQSPVFVDLGNDVTICQGGAAHLVAQVMPSIGMYTYQWQPVSGLSSMSSPDVYASPDSTTTYTFYVTNQWGCLSSASVTVTVIQCDDTISGRVFYDTNNDGIQDPGETGAPNILVQADTLNMNAISQSDGSYAMPVPQGHYIISPANLPYVLTSTPALHSVSFSSSGLCDSNRNFGLYMIPNVKDLWVSITASSAPRPGFANSFYLIYGNHGSLSMNGSVKLLVDSLYSIIGSNPANTGVSGDTLIWNFTGLAPFSSDTIVVNILLPSSATIGTGLSSLALISPVAGDTLPSDNSFTLQETIVGSYDPNDKSVSPTGYITPEQVAEGISLDYTIRFQNTGNAAAINIRVIDSLSSNLDLSTFQMIYASHTYSVDFIAPGVVQWTFSNIMLPDSGSNPTGSHGFVHFRIDALNTLNMGDYIWNKAFIYFDFNPAIVTNSVVTPVIFDIGIDENPAETGDFRIYPNPATDHLKLEYQSSSASLFELLNLQGAVVCKTSLPKGPAAISIPLPQLHSGMYFYRILGSAEEMLKSGKLIISGK